MAMRRLPFTYVTLASLGLLALAAVAALGDDKAARPKANVDASKSVKIEPPTVKVVAKQSATVAKTDNPKVKPGLVNWHKSFEEACTASQKSGKPVLLFQMMGKLDDQFC
jgi:hypothetical protein